MSCYLVTGGCGFIGSHLVSTLLDKGYGVKVLDDLSNGHRDSIPKKADLIIGSITDRQKVNEALEGVQGCFHLAAIASVPQSIQNWMYAHTVNLSGTVQLLEVMAQSKKTIPLIYASSAAVYGDCPHLPIREEETLQPLSPYGVDKMACEHHARMGWLLHAIPTTGFRLFNVYGPNCYHANVINLFAKKIFNGEKITLFGDGKQKRDFIYMDDVVRIMIQAMQRPFQGAEIYNLSSGIGTSILHVSNLLGRLINVEVSKDYALPNKGEIRFSMGDPSKLQRSLHLKTETSLEEGLSHVVKEIHNSVIME